MSAPAQNCELPPARRASSSAYRKVLSTPRGTMALQQAMRRFAAAKAAQAAAAEVKPAAEAPPAHRVLHGWRPALAARWRNAVRPWLRRLLPFCNRWSAMGAGLAAAVVLIFVMEVMTAGQSAAGSMEGNWLPRAPRVWWQHARQRAADGDYRLALLTVRHAIELSPLDPVLLTFEGDMHESLFQFRDAQESYERALSANPDYRPARRNFVLCRRINRQRDGTVRPGTLYRLHRVMLEQGRVGEALSIMQRLRDDRDLQRATWQAALDETGLAGTITLLPSGALELDLTENMRPDLGLIRSFPLASLNLAGTGVDDLSPLQGMALRTLDLSRTPVHDLAPLRGMPLETLRLPRTGVVDLGPLAGCPLRELDISGTRVTYLHALEGSPLETLHADDTQVTDLRPLAALPLTHLTLRRTRVVDLRPLTHLGLTNLALDGSGVSDLSPLSGCGLRALSLTSTPVQDLRPLAGMPLEVLELSGCPFALDLGPLASCAALEHLGLPARFASYGLLSGLPRLHFVRRDHLDLEEMPLLGSVGS